MWFYRRSGVSTIFGVAERLSLFDVIAQVTRDDMTLSEEEEEEEEGEEILNLGATSTSPEWNASTAMSTSASWRNVTVFIPHKSRGLETIIFFWHSVK